MNPAHSSDTNFKAKDAPGGSTEIFKLKQLSLRRKCAA